MISISTPECIRFHLDGVANIAQFLGLTEERAATSKQRRNIVVSNFAKVGAPISARLYLDVAAGDAVIVRPRLGRLKDLYGNTLGELVAPH
ncbi:hypothetical protein [Pseudomonas sp. B329]|uniref:hypothetical protein n=1 Tax=Pseudomonas sp. B329 TaxID=1553459 RepID=UPI0020055415|nr:hypothetical protein [Pseudomonas sp. B329]MCK3864842.1 hypothetical protein [Pseudomonas sp. B329]